ncbi:MAG TPA: tetratricopeptide repeat protein [Micropepsaceae bacterium]|nr:tetratricopeptide repeat protein [Micropepsaceae bacterium]
MSFSDTQLLEARKAHQAGDIREAGRLYSEVLRADPGNLQALYFLAQLRFAFSRFEDTERLTAEAVRRQPGFAEAWYLRGCALQRMEKHEDAISAFDRAATARANFAEAFVNRGGSLMALKRYDEALASFDRALELNTAMPEAWNNRGNALSALGRLKEAVEAYGKVLALRPGVPEALVNRGTALLDLGRVQEAWSSYDAALRALPQNPDALAGRANALFELKNYEASARDYRAALSVQPEYPYALGNLAFAKLHCCDWEGLAESRARIRVGLRERKKVINPFQAVALLESPEEQRLAAESWTKDKHLAQEPLWRGESFRHEKPRVVYLSGDFREHAVAQIMAGIFEQHDRKRIEPIGVSYGPDDGSAMRARLGKAFERLVDVRERSDREIAKLIREMEAEIVVDLTGFTSQGRPGILSHRPAPVQASYLGFPGTMAADYIDYMIADPFVITKEQRRHYAEKIAYLPHAYLPGDSSRAISPAPSRREAGLAEDAFVFASFNNSYKFTPESFDIWMRVLTRVPESVLWLSTLNAAATRNLQREAKNRGIDPRRLIFAPFVAKPEDHLARLKLADLFLDTLPYNAHATALDALWAGVPVVTCPGASFAARVSASLLQVVGMPELIAGSALDYERIVMTLAQDRTALAAAREKLAQNRARHPLFDTTGFVLALEDVYLAMWERFKAGEPPADLHVRA